MAEGKLFHHYETQDVLPTFGNLRSPAELETYAGQRRELFADKLMLPPALFRGADLPEFGPDSGENAMVFAAWGAQLTLVEPNRHVHERIRACLCTASDKTGFDIHATWPSYRDSLDVYCPEVAREG